MFTSTFWNNRLFGIKYWELGLAITFYLFFTLAYDITLYLTSGGKSDLYPTVFYEFGIKAVYTIPIWWLMFRQLAHWDMRRKFSLHLLLLPLFVVLQQQTYYLICELTNEWHLDWPAAWWDIYIPGMFYILQFGIFHTYDYYQRLQRQQRLEAELRQAALKSELIALKAQLNPHFLYNIFNTISASIPPSMENTREMIATLSDLFRYQTKGSRQELVKLEEELAFIRNYLELEKARFGERLHFYFEVPRPLYSYLVPPMILQPLVENAVKHGISPKIEGGDVRIKVEKVDQQLRFSICDTGMGLEKPQASNGIGIGLSNTQLRLEKMFGSQLRLVERPEGGLCVHFDIPAVTKSFVPNLVLQA
ncbi:MAG: histidine kinase [Bacteroidota bacterium]